MNGGERQASNLQCKAFAKINLSLEILGKRADGYHEIVTVMQTVAIHDQLTCRLSDELSLASDNPEMQAPDNLILQAARRLQAYARAHKGAAIYLEKHIPIAAGLGGGSSDAACTLWMLNKLWGLCLDLPHLVQIAAEIGSDVPFFFYGGTALAEGRGEIVHPLPPFPKRWIVLVCPRSRLPNKTRSLYARITPSDYTDGERTRRLARALLQGQPIDTTWLINAFLPIVLNDDPAIRACFSKMRELGLRPLLSGAGPSLFTIAESARDALNTQGLLHDLDADILVTETVSCSACQDDEL